MEKQNLVFEATNYVNGKQNSLMDELKDVQTQNRRVQRFARYLENNVPKKILNRCKVSFGQYSRWITVTINPKFGEQFSEHDTLIITAWAAENTKFEFDKELSGHRGTWNHRMKRDFGWRGSCPGGCYEINFQSTAEIDGCKMVKTTVTEERVVYKLDCE